MEKNMTLKARARANSDFVDPKTGIELLQEQISEAKQLLKNRPIKSMDHAIWNKTTRDYLIRIFGPDSPNIDTIISAPGSTAVWMGMPITVAEKYVASSMENKTQLLEGCIVSLKRYDLK
jgi:hypothetical protein